MNPLSEPRFRSVIFDLDGTLLDSLDDLADSMNAVLAAAGFPVHAVEAYRYFVGDGLDKLVERVLPEERRARPWIHRCAAAMRVEYLKRWNRKTRPYAGVPEMLDGLTGRDIPMNVLSNKMADFTRMAVSRLLSRWRFQWILGVSDGLPPKPDPTGALRISESLGIPPDRILFLGDTGTDMRTASAAGMHPIGALWGFRTASELRENGAGALIEHPRRLLEMI